MKKRKTNRMTALILAAALLLSNIPVTGFAQEETYCGLEHEHEAACYIDPNGGSPEPEPTGNAPEPTGSTPEPTQAPQPAPKKTLLENLLAAQSLQQMYDLLSGNEAGAQALNASQLSLVRQRADTIFAETEVTEAEQTRYNNVSNLLIQLVKRLQSEAQKSPEPDSGETEPPAPVVPEKTLYEKLLEAQSLQELHTLLEGDKAGAYTLTAEQLTAVRTQVNTLYGAISEPTADDGTYYEQLRETLDLLEKTLQGGGTDETTPKTLEQMPINGCYYFDLCAGDVTITGADGTTTLTGARYDGNETEQTFTYTVTGTDPVKVYVYQSNHSATPHNTGIVNNTLLIPNPARVDGWGSSITNKTDVEAVISAWLGKNRPSTTHVVKATGKVNCEVVLDNIYSTAQEYGTSKEHGGVCFIPTAASGSRLTLKLKGDNRVGNVFYYSASDSNKLLFESAPDQESPGTLTVANIANNSNKNYWCAAIGGNDSTKDAAAGIVINSGIIFAGTNAADDCTAIGGGGNGYGDITINGGTVTAVVTSSGAAIGGGIGKTSYGGTAKITITGGNVYAYNNSCSSTYSNQGFKYIPAAAIGGGSSARQKCYASTINISGGTIYAQSVGGTAIGGGSSSDADGGDTTINITGGKVEAYSVPGTINGQSVPAGVSIGGGTGFNNGGSATLNISGDAVVRTGSIGGGGFGDKENKDDVANTIGFAQVTITGGNLRGQVVMEGEGSFLDMRGGTINNAKTTGVNYSNCHFVEKNGGAACVKTGTVTISGAALIKNAAAEKGGAIYLSNGNVTMSNGTIESCSAQSGGAVYVTGGNFTMTGGTIDGNSATAANGEGGAVYVTGGNIILGTEGCTDAGCLTVSNNSAANGGAFAVAGATPIMYCGTLTGNTATEKGGALYVSGSGGFTMTGGIIDGGTLEDGSPKTNAVLGGGVYLAGGAFTLEGTTAVIRNNHATNGAGVYLAGGKPNLYQGALQDNTASGDGGGIYIDKQAVKLEPKALVSITGNRADRGAGIFIGGSSTTPAGFAVDKTKPGRVEITDNTASGTNGNGGGVCISYGYFSLDANNITLQRNRAVSGGAVAVLSGNFTMSDGSIGGADNGNTAQDGGAVYVSGGNVILSGGEIRSNEADRNGGGIAVLDGQVNMTGGSVSENRANSGEGGSIYVSSSGSTPVSVMVYGGTLSNNFAARTGGAVSVQGGSGDITVQVGVNEEHFAGSSWNHTFEHDIDGAVYASAECPVIRNNTSGVSGGAFYIKGASTTRLNIYCLTDENNRTNGDKNPLNENMSNFMMVEGGRVYLSTANQYEGVEGTPNVSPDGDDTSGHMSINGSIHVVSGVLELFGSKDNPRLNGGLTLDIRSTSDKFIDHRKSEDKLTVSYHENFFYPDGTPASRQTAFDIEAEQTHEIYGGLYAHEGYKLYGWNTSSGANPTVDTEGWYKTGDVYTLRMPTTENPDGTRDGLNHFGNLTLYAIWESNGYYVNYVSGVEQGQEYTGKDRTEPYTYDAANQYFLDNWFVWPGHEFTGWLLPDGSIKQPGDAVPNLTTENAATVIVTAQWKPCEHLTGDFSYTLEEDTITKTCNVCKYSATARLTARNATYDGSRHEAVLECSDEAFWKPQVSYVGYTIKPQAAEDTWQPEAIAEDRLCIGAGNYTATITGGDKTVTATYTIAKAKQEAPASRPSYQQPEGGTNKLTVNQIPQAQRLGQSGEHVVYIVRYFEDGNQKDIPVNIPDGDPDQLTVELPALLKVYSVFAGYPETDDYLASELVSAELSFLFTGTLKILVRAEEGINVWLGQVTTDGKDEWVLFAKLISEDDYYLIGEDFTFTKTVTDQPEGESYDANKLTVTKATTITDGYLMSVTEPPEKMTEITIVVGGVKKKADITGYAREKQHFSDFAEQKDPVISRDSAFTARFAVTSYDTADYHPLKLTFSQPLPGGTTIILRDRSDESYWYTAVTAGATEVALSSFTRMAAGGGAYSAGTDMDLQFVVDFSRAASPITAESLTCALSAAAQDADSNVVALSAPLNIGLAGAWLSLDEDVDGSGLSQQIRIKAGAGGAASKYDHRDMALVLTPATTLPPDAYIRMTMGENVSECRPDKTGKIIVPLGNFRALDTDILLDLCSNMFPVNDGSDTEYTMTAQLYLAQTDAEIAPLQAEAPRSTVQLKFTVNKHRTGISIAVANDQRLFTTADTIAATVTVKPAIYNLLYSVDVELHQEFEGNIFGDSMVSVQKSGNTYTFDLNDRPTGDYCIVAALKTRAGYTINEARYYFIIQPSPNDGG